MVAAWSANIVAACHGWGGACHDECMAKSNYVVQRSTTINADPDRIYDQVADFHEWMKWSPWEDLDPNQQRTFTGSDSGVGAMYAWSGNRKAGSGTMEVTEASAPSKVRIALEFVKPFKSRNTTTFSIRPDGDASVVRWTMTGPTTFVTRLMGLFSSMDKMIGTDFEKGLTRLKADAERR